MAGVSEIGQDTTVKVWRGRTLQVQTNQEEELHESDDDSRDILAVSVIFSIGPPA